MDKTKGFYPFDPGSSPGGDTALRKTKTAFCFLAVSAADIFLFQILEIKMVEAGSRVLSKINTKYLFWVVTRDHLRLRPAERVIIEPIEFESRRKQDRITQHQVLLIQDLQLSPLIRLFQCWW